MEIEVKYVSQRSEIWSWYWSQWRKKLWKVHAAYIVAAVALEFILSKASYLVRLEQGLVVAFVVVGFMVICPQLKFKAAERTLRLDGDGIAGVIGRTRYQRPWKSVRLVEDRGDSLALVMANGNAFVVPDRAFADAIERDHFKSYAISQSSRR